MKFIIEFEGKFFDCEWFDNTYFEKLEKERVTQVYGFIFDEKNKVCIVNMGKRWTTPGGKPEKEDKTYEETLIRETDEEADLELKDIKRVGYIKIIPRGYKAKVNYLLRFAAKIKKIKTQTIDPATNVIPERKFVNQEDFLKYTQWGEDGKLQFEKAREVMEKLKLE